MLHKRVTSHLTPHYLYLVTNIIMRIQTVSGPSNFLSACNCTSCSRSAMVGNGVANCQATQFMYAHHSRFLHGGLERTPHILQRARNHCHVAFPLLIFKCTFGVPLFHGRQSVVKDGGGWDIVSHNIYGVGSGPASGPRDNFRP